METPLVSLYRRPIARTVFALLLSYLSEQDALLRRPIRMLEDPSSAHSGLKTVNYTQRI